MAAAATVVASLVVMTGPLLFSADATAPPPRAPGAAATRSVTLLTGVGDGHSNGDVVRPHGAVGAVRTETVGKDLYVIPDEIMPYLAADELDRHLFDVTSLINDGYDDQHSTGIPMILSYARRSTAPKSALAMPRGLTEVRALSSINSSAVLAAKTDAPCGLDSADRRFREAHR